jgi:RNase P subunit RPR2
MGNKAKRPERYKKRLECEFSGSGMKYKGFVSDISEAGLFIRTRRSFREDSGIDVKIYLPDGSISNVSGVVRRALNYQEANLVKNGMGIELTERDDNFIRFFNKMKGVEDKEEIKAKPENRKPEKVVVQCPACGVKNAVPSDKLSLGPKCGGCKAPLVPKEEEPAPEETPPPEEKKQDEFVIVKCPGCGAKNKLPANKLSLGPKCGNCKEPLPTE